MSSVPSEECVVSSHSHRAPSEHTEQAVNSTAPLAGGETEMTNGLTRATVHPYRSSSCRNNLQQQVAPRRQRPWVPSLSRNGFFGLPPLGAIPTLVREYLFCGSWASFSSGCQPGVRVVPLVRWPVLGSPPLVRSTIARWQEATDPQSPEGGSQRACHTGGAHSTASGRLEGVALIEQTALFLQLGSCLFGLQAREF